MARKQNGGNDIRNWQKAKPFGIVSVSPDSLTIFVNSNRYSKELFFLAVQLLREKGEAGAELRPTKTNYPVEGTIDHVVRPKNDKGNLPPMRATWIGAILVRSGVAIQTKDKPAMISLSDKYLI
jgi:hypothetical protein